MDLTDEQSVRLLAHLKAETEITEKFWLYSAPYLQTCYTANIELLQEDQELGRSDSGQAVCANTPEIIGKCTILS